MGDFGVTNLVELFGTALVGVETLLFPLAFKLLGFVGVDFDEDIDEVTIDFNLLGESNLVGDNFFAKLYTDCND
jgi:hypothetical protein